MSLVTGDSMKAKRFHVQVIDISRMGNARSL
jgi:hypothetical protein